MILSFYRVVATLVCYPLDLLKTRLQVSGEGVKKSEYPNTIALVRDITKKQGISGFYKGLSASILRQAVYTGVRIGAFQTFIDYFSV